MKTIMITQRFEDFGKIKPIPYAFRDWLHKLNRNEKLPRGKYFKGKVGGKPMVILDEFWSLFNTQNQKLTSIHCMPHMPYYAIKDYGSLREILLENPALHNPTPNTSGFFKGNIEAVMDRPPELERTMLFLEDYSTRTYISIPTEEPKSLLDITQDKVDLWHEPTGNEGGIAEYQQWLLTKGQSSK